MGHDPIKTGTTVPIFRGTLRLQVLWRDLEGLVGIQKEPHGRPALEAEHCEHCVRSVVCRWLWSFRTAGLGGEGFNREPGQHLTGLKTWQTIDP